MHVRTKIASVSLAAKSSGAFVSEQAFGLACEAIGNHDAGSARDLLTELLDQGRRKSVGVTEMT